MLRAVLLAVLMTLPPAAALDLPTLPGLAAPGDLPPECVAENGTYACAFYANTTAQAGQQRFEWDIPSFPRTLATVTVALQGMDNGWQVQLVHPDEDDHVTSQSAHRADTTNGVSHREATTHVFLGGTPMRLRLLTDDPQSGAGPDGVTPPSSGRFQVFYLAEPVPDGAPPERPAATAAYPQMPGRARDAPRPEVDLVAAWLDDPREGDGLFDVNVQVLGNLDRMDWNASSAPVSLPVGPSQFQPSRVEYEVHFKVQGVQYYVQFVMMASRSGGGYRASPLTCGLYAAPEDPNEADALVSVPDCAHDATTLRASVPERSIRSPGPGVRFEELSVNVDDVVVATGRSQQDVQPRDSAIAQFPFALGGPAVWDELNGCAFCPVEPAWYEPAYLEAHLADVVQTVRAAVAVITFFIGLLLVRRRRAQTKRLLDEVARVEQEHETDTRAALLALGKLDTRFARLFHDHTITDAQYQVLAQRVATAATRFALRQGLGLDDGLAGDRVTRRVPVVDADADRAREARS